MGVLSKVPVYIFDIDGTCADHSHRLPLIAAGREGGKDWTQFHELCDKDPPIAAVCKLARTLHFGHAPLIFMTGRMEFQRHKTINWLSENTGITYWGAWEGSMGPYQGFDYNEFAQDAHWRPKGGFPWLMMRAEGDFREDTLVKGEMLDRAQTYLKARMPDFEITMAFEDRPRICELWEKRGLTVAKIGNWTEAQQAPEGEAWKARLVEVIGTDDEQLGLERARW